MDGNYPDDDDLDDDDVAWPTMSVFLRYLQHDPQDKISLPNVTINQPVRQPIPLIPVNFFDLASDKTVTAPLQYF